MKSLLRRVLSARVDSGKYFLSALLVFVAIPSSVALGSIAWADTDLVRSKPLADQPKGDSQVISFEINYDFHSSGQLTSMRVIVGTPKTIEGSQNVIKVSFSPAPIAVYDDNDTRYAVFNFHNPPNNVSLNIKGEIELHRRDLVTSLSSWNAAGQSNIATLSNAERAEYLKSEKYLEVDDPGIREIANTIESPSSRLAKMSQRQGVEVIQTAEIETVQEILQWLRRNVKYEKDDAPSGAAATARLRKGKCQHFSELFITFCRAKGLPTKYVGGLNTYFDKRNPNVNPSHAWAEVFLSGLGWVPFDPTWMESTSDVVKPIYLCDTRIRNNIALGMGNQIYWSYYYKSPVKVSLTDSYKFRALSP